MSGREKCFFDSLKFCTEVVQTKDGLRVEEAKFIHKYILVEAHKERGSRK